MHTIVDVRGLPVKLLLTPSKTSDKAAAPTMLEGLPTAQAFVGDRGYDWQALVDPVKSNGCRALRKKMRGVVWWVAWPERPRLLPPPSIGLPWRRSRS
ncbi:transposase [Magnetospirillum sp. ME-1]|uniref:transposase n=1 Tax=Magnetospirillum sp. ME-1 TaxID=1639348 RepID=UPI003FA5E4A8